MTYSIPMGRLIVICALAFLGAKPLLAADAPSEYQMKSAFIYNFATFIDWPADIGKKLTLCVAVPPDSTQYFTQLAGKPIGNMTLAVRPLAQADSAEGCRILFVSDSQSASFDDWLSEVGDEEVLTIAESEDWLKKGVVMTLVLQDNRVTFDVNLEAARGENIAISSRLLRLARKVYGLEATDESADKKSK
jgi:YfiR/HmsC-like